MSAQGTPSIPAGWYPDPENPAQGRFWDGTAWTSDLHQPGQAFPAAPALKAPEGTTPNTPWVWLIVLPPVLVYIPLLFLPWSVFATIDPFRPMSIIQAEFALLLSPAYLVSIGLSALIYALGVVFAYLDVRELTRRGVPKPFHWAFAFISGVVYTIGRAVVAHRRTGSGHAPIWAEVGVFVVGVVITIVIVFQAMGALMSAMPNLVY